jgi:hypothetical protein
VEEYLNILASMRAELASHSTCVICRRSGGEGQICSSAALTSPPQFCYTMKHSAPGQGSKGVCILVWPILQCAEVQTVKL